MRIGLLPMGPVPKDLMAALSDSLRAYGLDPSLLPDAAVPGGALDAARGQYRAEALLAEVTARSSGPAVAVTTVDLFTEGLNFVFGLANVRASGAVVSVHRLADADRGLVADRLLKEVVHELGHTWGLVHCGDSTCVMHFSNELAETDAKDAVFCAACRESLPRGIGGESAHRA